MKKYIALLLILILTVANISPITAFASDVPILSVSSSSGHIGDTVTLDVKIENNPGLAFFQIDLMFDNTKLKPKRGGIMGTEKYKGITSNISDPNVNLDEIDSVTAVWDNTALINNTDDGVIFSVSFEVIGNSINGIPVMLNIDEGNIADINFVEQNDLRFYDGIVTVLEEGEISGAVSVNKGITAYMVDETVCRATVINDDDDVTDCILVGGLYNRDTGALSDTVVCNLTVSNGSITKRLPFKEYDAETQYVKLFLWDTNMDPMCLPYIVY